MSEVLYCWRCGAELGEVPLPMACREECRACHADQHVCRMCRFYSSNAPRSCREPVAEEVADKTRANFCGYFQPAPGARQGDDGRRRIDARAGLEALFGETSKPAEGAPSVARARLDELFK